MRALTICIVAMALVGGEASQAAERLFPPDAVVNVTQAPYGAIPDDGQDDTAAIQRAITANVGTGRSLYFPAGVYEISDSLICRNAEGKWESHITFQGQDRERTILKLRNSAEGFADPAKPRAMIVTASHWDPGDDNAAPGGGNKAFRNYFFDLTLDAGAANAGAIGIEWANSNWGAISNVTVRGRGAAGIAMKRAIPGPGYIKNVLVEGFDYGVDVGDMQYGFTLEHVTLRNQAKAGIRLDRNLLHIRDLRSENEVPAIITTGIQSTLVLLNSLLRGTAAGQNVLDLEGNHLVLGVTFNPDSAWRSNGEPQPKVSSIGGFIAPAATMSSPPSGRSIKPEDAPTFWNDDLSDWAGIGPRREGETDDTQAIQRSLDSGKSTVYFANDRVYFISDTLVVRGKVKQVLGMGAEISLGGAKEPFSDADNPRPLIRIDETERNAVFFEQMFFNAQYPGEVIFENNSPRDVVIRHCGGWVGSKQFKRTYRNTERATGKLFVEDVFLPGWSFKNQTVFARQFNPENQENVDGSIPQVLNDGGRLWILGFKTEGQAPFIVTKNRGVTDVRGAYNYISATVPPTVPEDAVPYVFDDSSGAITFVADNFRDSDYRVYIRETAGGKVVKEWKPADFAERPGLHRSIVVPSWTTGGPDAKW